MDGASRALKDAPQRFLDALVDATFRFTDQALNSAEVGSLGGNETKPSMAFPPSCMLTVSIGLCLQSNFAPVDETGEAIEIHQSQIQGAIPDGFPEGVYIRNGDGFSHFPLLALSVSMSERERESERPVNIVLGSNPLFGALHSTSSVLGQSREIWVEGEGMRAPRRLLHQKQRGSSMVSLLRQPLRAVRDAGAGNGAAQTLLPPCRRGRLCSHRRRLRFQLCE